MDCDKFLIFLALASFGFGYGNAIRCFYCQSNIDARCEKSQDISGRMELMIDCNKIVLSGRNNMTHPAMCSKTIKYMHNQRIVTRGCFFDTPRSLAYSDLCMRNMADSDVSYEMCVTCDIDLCNGVASERSTITSVLIASLSLFLSAQLLI